MTVSRTTALITDSTVSLPPGLAEELGISVVPMHVTMGGQSYRDGIDITAGELYRLLRAGAELPRTSTPDPGSFVAAFEEAAANAQSIVCVVISRRYSTVLDAANTAADAFREQRPEIDLRLVDSGTAAGAQAALMVATARRIEANTSADEVEALINALKDRSYMLATLDTLQYVGKGGHVPRVAAWAGDLLRVKPILEMAPGGEINRPERPRTRRRAIERLVHLAQQKIGDASALMNVIHADALEEAENLKARVTAEFQCEEIFLTEFSPVIGAHTGPGVLGLAFCIASSG
jgi:DegV family protein with EDD domain